MDPVRPNDPDKPTPPPDDPKFKICQAGLEAATFVAAQDGITDVDVLIVVNLGDPEDSKGGSLSNLPPDQHLDMLVRATQSFADITEQPIQVMRIEGGGRG